MGRTARVGGLRRSSAGQLRSAPPLQPPPPGVLRRNIKSAVTIRAGADRVRSTSGVTAGKAFAAVRLNLEIKWTLN
jgi:hypothetical protein